MIKVYHLPYTAPHTETNSLISTETNDCLISTETNSLISTETNDSLISTETNGFKMLTFLYSTETNDFSYP